MKYVFIVSVLALMAITLSPDAFAESVDEEVVMSAKEKPLVDMNKEIKVSMIKSQTVSPDGSTWIFLTTSKPIEGKQMTINVRFTDNDGKELEHINYDISASQNGKVVLSEMMIHQHIGINDHRTKILSTDDKVDINITLQGVGMTKPFTGPQGESIIITVVPEFGVIVMMILAISLLSIMVITTKSKMMFKP